MKVQANNTKELIIFFSWTMFFFFGPKMTKMDKAGFQSLLWTE